MSYNNLSNKRNCSGYTDLAMQSFSHRLYHEKLIFDFDSYLKMISS